MVRDGAKRKAGGERFLTPPRCGGFGNDGVRREARMRQETERFLSAQADPSWEMKGRRKSACSVRNDGVRVCGRGRRGDGGDRDAERFLTPPRCGGFGMTGVGGNEKQVPHTFAKARTDSG